MIVVTGSRRSGTSMWMQILAAAGLPVIGERFPLDWETTLGPVNPHGFYESTLREGIHWGTNPDPRSGEYLHPDDTTLHAVKIFPEGLVRSDLAFLDRVLVTIRPWHEYVASIERLLQVENEARGWSDADRPPRLHPAIEWWVGYFSLVRDIALRRYRVHLQPYARVLSEPREVVPRVLAWITEGTEAADLLDVDAAIGAVKAARRGDHDAELGRSREGIDASMRRVLDDFYAAVLAGEGLSTTLLASMNALQETLAPTLEAHGEAMMKWLAERPPGATAAEPLALTAAEPRDPERASAPSRDASRRP